MTILILTRSLHIVFIRISYPSKVCGTIKIIMISRKNLVDDEFLAWRKIKDYFYYLLDVGHVF